MISDGTCRYRFFSERVNPFVWVCGFGPARRWAERSFAMLVRRSRPSFGDYQTIGKCGRLQSHFYTIEHAKPANAANGAPIVLFTAGSDPM